MQVSNAQLIAQLSQDRAGALDALFGAQHEDETPPFHLEIIDLWSAADEFILLEGFRESAKTTLALEFLTTEALFGNYRYALFIADKYEKACEKLETVKWHLKTNAALKALFGDTIGDRDNESILQLKNGTRIQAMGREQSPRGLLHHTARPDRIYIDDPENRERGDVASTQSVDATIKWLYADVLPALDKTHGKIRINATPLARDCLVTRLKADAERHWLHRTYPIVIGDIDDDRAIPMWPARYPLHWVRRQRDMYRSQGLLTTFMQEYMCRAEEESEKIFPASGLAETAAPSQTWMPTYVIYDPARTAKKNISNLTGKVVVSIVGSKLIVRESSGNLWKPSEIIKDIFETNEEYCPIGIGVESNSLEEFLMEPLRNQQLLRHVSLPLIELRAPTDRNKEDFIKGLQPYHKAGEIFLEGGLKAHQRLVMEMESFPSKNDDVINALAYALRIRVGEPVYPDFGAENVIEQARTVRGQPVYLAFNASGKEITCVACQLVGQTVTVVDEWTIAGDMNDAVQSIKLAVSGVFSRERTIAFVPADLIDDWARIPLVSVLRGHQMQASRAGYGHESRGELASYIRTRIRGLPALVVGEHCRSTINGLAAGYALAVTPAGRLAEQAVENPYRTLIVGLECLVHALNSGAVAGMAQANYSISPGGTKFLTSRPDLARK